MITLSRILKWNFRDVIATATDMANESKRILDDVIHRGEAVEIQRHGKG
jgi:hypothetical protein